MTELCNNCSKHEAEYDSPDKLCTPCWMDWWYEEYTPEERSECEPGDYILTAYHDLGTKVSDEKLLSYIESISHGTVDMKSVKTILERDKKEIVEVSEMGLDDCNDVLYTALTGFFDLAELGPEDTPAELKLRGLARSIKETEEKLN